MRRLIISLLTLARVALPAPFLAVFFVSIHDDIETEQRQVNLRVRQQFVTNAATFGSGVVSATPGQSESSG